MTPALVAAATAPAAAPNANAAPAATAGEAGAVAPFLLELGALASAEVLPAAEPATEPAPAAEDSASAEAVVELLNLILAATPPPPAAAASLPATATSASELPTSLPATPVAGLAVADAEVMPIALDAPALPTAALPVPMPALPPPMAASTATPATPVTTPASTWPPLALDQPNWSRELGERLLWTSDQGLSEATIELHPDELGPIRVRIDTEGDTANVALQATHAATRELLAFSLPQLRELLNANGLQLGRSQVGSTAPASSGRESARSGEDATRGALPVRRRWRVGLVDQYV